jgi:gamma-glutamylcyclotransferase (GGCT)/AIG2-like uncharacterized protein YtfP
MMKKGDLVFVYGTLRTGERMSLSDGFYKGMCTRIGDDVINGGLFNLGSFPGLKPVSEVTGPFSIAHPQVVGEVFEVTDNGLPQLLDSYEGYPNLYDRRKVPTKNGRDAWVYTYNGRVNEDALIVSGDWKSRVLRRAA